MDGDIFMENKRTWRRIVVIAHFVFLSLLLNCVETIRLKLRSLDSQELPAQKKLRQVSKTLQERQKGRCVQALHEA